MKTAILLLISVVLASFAFAQEPTPEILPGPGEEKKPPAVAPPAIDEPAPPLIQPAPMPEAPPEATDPAKPPPAPFTSARQLLALFDIDFSQLRFLIDGRDFDQEEHETLLRILQQIPRIDPQAYFEWQHKTPWAQVVEKPDVERAEVFHVRCRVKQVDVVPLRTEQVKRFEMRSYYQVRGELEGSKQEVMLFCRNVPAAWKIGIPIDERAAFWGLFLKTGPAPMAEGGLAPLYFAALHVGWLPDRVDKDLRISEAKKTLGDYGFDVTLLDEVSDNQRILTAEREGFYQLLAALARGSTEARKKGQLRLFEYKDGKENLTRLGPLLMKPKELRGELVTVEGRVRMATKIMVRDPDIHSRMPFDHYYQLVLYVNEAVKVAVTPKDGKKPVMLDFQTYPIMICTLELPPEIKADGEGQNVHAQVTGWYYKLYTYDTQFMESKRSQLNLAGQAEQMSPLIVTDQPIVVIEEHSTLSSPYIGPIVLAVIVGVLVLFFYNARRFVFNSSERTKIEIKANPDGPRVDVGEVHVDPYKKKESTPETQAE